MFSRKIKKNMSTECRNILLPYPSRTATFELKIGTQVTVANKETFTPNLLNTFAIELGVLSVRTVQTNREADGHGLLCDPQVS